VVVERVAPELAQAGITQRDIQRDAEEKVRAAGIPLLSQEECWRTPGMPWLYITVALLKATDTTYAATIAANLYQEVQLMRTPHLKTFGVTWDAGVHVGAVNTEQLTSVRQSVGALVDQFVADYQAANRMAKQRTRYGGAQKRAPLLPLPVAAVERSDPRARVGR
jgi:hypothetical protein